MVKVNVNNHKLVTCQAQLGKIRQRIQFVSEHTCTVGRIGGARIAPFENLRTKGTA